MNSINPRNAIEALRYAKTAEKAQAIADVWNFDYLFAPSDDGTTRVMKADASAEFGFRTEYVISLQGECSCPDFARHGNYCKHTLAAAILAERELDKWADEQAAMYEEEKEARYYQAFAR